MDVTAYQHENQLDRHKKEQKQKRKVVKWNQNVMKWTCKQKVNNETKSHEMEQKLMTE